MVMTNVEFLHQLDSYTLREEAAAIRADKIVALKEKEQRQSDFVSGTKNSMTFDRGLGTDLDTIDYASIAGRVNPNSGKLEGSGIDYLTNLIKDISSPYAALQYNNPYVTNDLGGAATAQPNILKTKDTITGAITYSNKPASSNIVVSKDPVTGITTYSNSIDAGRVDTASLIDAKTGISVIQKETSRIRGIEDPVEASAAQSHLAANVAEFEQKAALGYKALADREFEVNKIRASVADAMHRDGGKEFSGTTKSLIQKLAVVENMAKEKADYLLANNQDLNRMKATFKGFDNLTTEHIKRTLVFGDKKAQKQEAIGEALATMNPETMKNIRVALGKNKDATMSDAEVFEIATLTKDPQTVRAIKALQEDDANGVGGNQRLFKEATINGNKKAATIIAARDSNDDPVKQSKILTSITDFSNMLNNPAEMDKAVKAVFGNTPAKMEEYNAAKVARNSNSPKDKLEAEDALADIGRTIYTIKTTNEFKSDIASWRLETKQSKDTVDAVITKLKGMGAPLTLDNFSQYIIEEASNNPATTRKEGVKIAQGIIKEAVDAMGSSMLGKIDAAPLTLSVARVATNYDGLLGKNTNSISEESQRAMLFDKFMKDPKALAAVAFRRPHVINATLEEQVAAEVLEKQRLEAITAGASRVYKSIFGNNVSDYK